MITEYRIKPAYQGGVYTHKVAGGIQITLNTLEYHDDRSLSSFWAFQEFKEYIEAVPVRIGYEGVIPESLSKSTKPRNGK
jgi:hypothetical protein